MADQNDNNWERPMIQNNFYGNIGQQINHVDKIEAHFDKDMGIEVDGQNILKDMAQAPSPDEDWIDQIVPCFMGVKANALDFCKHGEKYEANTDYGLGQRMAGGKEDQHHQL